MASRAAPKRLDSKTSKEKEEEALEKLNSLTRKYNIAVINPSRPGKSLLVIDIDLTLLDYQAYIRKSANWMRPFVQTFLETCYLNYDLAIWSATEMASIHKKMRMMNIESNENAKFVFYLDFAAMAVRRYPNNSTVRIKPLSMIWDRFPQYTPRNTVMLDDIRANFLENPKNGLVIRKYRDDQETRKRDHELLFAALYLKEIVTEKDLRALNLKEWDTNVAGRKPEEISAILEERKSYEERTGSSRRTFLIPRPKKRSNLENIPGPSFRRD